MTEIDRHSAARELAAAHQARQAAVARTRRPWWFDAGGALLMGALMAAKRFDPDLVLVLGPLMLLGLIPWFVPRWRVGPVDDRRARRAAVPILLLYAPALLLTGYWTPTDDAQGWLGASVVAASTFVYLRVGQWYACRRRVAGDDAGRVR